MPCRDQQRSPLAAAEVAALFPKLFVILSNYRFSPLATLFRHFNVRMDRLLYAPKYIITKTSGHRMKPKRKSRKRGEANATKFPAFINRHNPQTDARTHQIKTA